MTGPPMTEMTTFAEELLAAYRAGTRIAPQGALPTSAAQAYAVQSYLLAALGPAGGFKVGLKPDAPPIMAPIMAARCQPSGSRYPVTDRIGVELEVGWKIVAPLPDPAQPDYLRAVTSCIVPLPVIELVDTRISGPAAADPLVKLADFQINSGLILGAPLADWDGGDFTHLTGRMQVGAQVLLEGATEVPGGSALGTLHALHRAIGDHCGGLQPGQIVITGTIHPLTYVPGNIEVRGEISGLGTVSVSLETLSA
ncbi:hypothetical protein OE699_03005 [Sedimentimonas flavescens]|uniref:2-keto-4-pentenoate hydratase n=1 Tax=Sedimentimonas flavescens TaxID=2851012 RepID=A0ABT2ZVQ0_9RHOB|nr:hypothetical protein [Sedimentimonas flavescens]MCV2877810.1 hypothetical protein [Sedimentimonas flavescens]